jgi:hypothetical protein
MGQLISSPMSHRCWRRHAPLSASTSLWPSHQLRLHRLRGCGGTDSRQKHGPRCPCTLRNAFANTPWFPWATSRALTKSCSAIAALIDRFSSSAPLVGAFWPCRSTLQRLGCALPEKNTACSKSCSIAQPVVAIRHALLSVRLPPPPRRASQLGVFSQPSCSHSTLRLQACFVSRDPEAPIGLSAYRAPTHSSMRRHQPCGFILA